jgi:amidase
VTAPVASVAGWAAADIARAVRSRQISPVQVLEEHLVRLHQLNGHLNAVVAERAVAARTDARELERRLASGQQVGPLAGVPFTAKDVLATADLPTTCGSAAVVQLRPAVDATAVARIRAADGILIGKTNCPEFALGIDTVNELYGRTRNPLGPFTPGGSSGGESSAVAAGMSALGLGSDYGGSIRWPAQCTGLVGLRPTVGRVPGTGQLPAEAPYVPNPRTLQGQVQVIGPLARSVRDVSLAMTVLSGPDGIDASVTPAPWRDSAHVRPDRLELRWGTDLAGFNVDREVGDVVAAAVKALQRVGVRSEHGLPPALSLAADVYSGIRDADPLAEIEAAAAGREDMLGTGIRSLLDRRQPTSERRLVELWAARSRLRAELAGWLYGERLLVLPVALVAPFDPTNGVSNVRGQQLTGFDVLTPCRVVSLFGLPSLSVPFGRSTTGAPLSVQLVAPAFREDLVLGVGSLLEDARKSR